MGSEGPAPVGRDGRILRPGNIVISTASPSRFSQFWSSVTGYVPRTLFEPYLGLRDPFGVGANLTFQRVLPGELARGGRSHIDLYVGRPAEAAARAEQAGARVLRRVEEGDTSWVVLADPDGNEFCFVAAVGPDRWR